MRVNYPQLRNIVHTIYLPLNAVIASKGSKKIRVDNDQEKAHRMKFPLQKPSWGKIDN